LSTAARPAEPDYGGALVGKTFEDGDALVRFERRSDGDVVAWRAACNTNSSSVSVLEARLDIGVHVVSSAIGCSPEREAADDALRTFMESDPQWSLSGGRLTLRLGGESRTFEQA